ncbi:DUF2690 domain-containing protein [Microbispora sp. H10830]|uniref:DUF2690 domain-containing protein n=1 Tax=Microbispora sp. H10830 TaxID=2729109 RepID=UPI001601AB65|nr:DUF2690 domain-containing protein [Microbispora sp. H10830]
MARWRVALALEMTLLPTLGIMALATGGTTANAESVAPAATPTPASRCHETPSKATCDNTDPETTGCSAGAYTVGSSTLWFHNTRGERTVAANATIELRYSPTCKTNWARATVNSRPDRGDGLVSVELCRGSGSTDCTDQYSAYNTWAYSDQLYAPNVVAYAYGWCCAGNGSGGASGSFGA